MHSACKDDIIKYHETGKIKSPININYSETVSGIKVDSTTFLKTICIQHELYTRILDLSKQSSSDLVSLLVAHETDKTITFFLSFTVYNVSWCSRKVFCMVCASVRTIINSIKARCHYNSFHL